jgi:hypothetical protein
MVAEKKSGTALEPFQQEENWLAISITLAIIAAVLGGFGLLWIFDLGPIEKIDDRIKVATLVGTGLLALITYSTVVWRGLVGARQANEQKRTNDEKGEENIARLLLDGAELIGEKDYAKAAAGIAALELVVVKSIGDFGSSAMNILADFIVREITLSSSTKNHTAARKAMEKGAKRGNLSDRELEIKKSKNDEHVIYYGFKSVIYSNDRLFQASDVSIDLNQTSIFSRVNLVLCEINISKFEFYDCLFYRCSISNIDTDTLSANTYNRCNFSGATIHNEEHPIPPDEEELAATYGDNLKDCFYLVDVPPRWTGFYHSNGETIGMNLSLSYSETLFKSRETALD